LNIELTVLSFNELIDSSDVSPHHWLELARIIHDFYEDYDGFVILHGTDTMAYTASALSFLLRNLGKPVIMTGAQLPIGASRTDARENLITALEIASAKADGMALVPEVCIYFDHLLLRGNRAKKVQNFNFTAFESANYPPLAVAGIHVDYNIPLIRPYNGAYFKIHQNLDNRVAILKLFPGLGKAFVEPVLSNTNLRGLVLETFGSGNAPTAPWLLTLIKEVVESGVYVLNVTQCDGGSVTQGKYITSKHLADIGVLGGADLTTEAAVTKMMSILGNFTEPSQIKELLVTSIAGEMS
jgi:L-asparaginase